MSILFLAMPLLTSSLIRSVRPRHIESMLSMCSGQSLLILYLSNHTLEKAPFIGVYGLEWWKAKNQMIKQAQDQKP